VEISGHTDNVGKRSTNMKLSQQRADAVKAWLVAKGIDASRMTAKGYGPDKPVAPNTTAEGRAKNRRIDFTRTK
jgi:OOP family OmpA-OmpF porin